MSLRASSPSSSPVVHREDYTPPAFLIDATEMDLELDPKKTRVRITLTLHRNPEAPNPKASLILNGETQKLIGVWQDDVKLKPSAYTLTEQTLTLTNLPDRVRLRIESTHAPTKNTALSGLYVAGPLLCTQCEPEGFRRITYYLDRPDVLAPFTVTLHADKAQYPALLANGNRIARGEEPNGRHWVRWEDPFPKPCYLFAVVAGDLDSVRRTTKTKQGRPVDVAMYVEKGRTKETAFALQALDRAMRWDETTYGLSYDLDLFMIVAVSFFNMGAMENKGLNIFNDACVLGRAETATDGDIAFIERVVGHEYFHNWTGDRVTCRDWFQLSLKEGLTVFREQEFCAAQHGHAFERMMTVSQLRRGQFTEDAGAMAHPVRPDSYEAIDNFYTSTVYQKGAEVVRMIQTFVGKPTFRKGLRLYLKRHDGQAATCEDFVQAHADASGRDFTQFLRWYSQAGTPVLNVRGAYDATEGTYRLTVRQTTPPTPGQPTKKPLHLPLAVGLLDAEGHDLIGTRVLEVRKAREVFVIEGLPKGLDVPPVPSLLRDFSAPVRLDYPSTESDLLHVVAHDIDPLNRWDAGQTLLRRCALARLGVGSPRAGKLSARLVESFRAALTDSKAEAALRAMMLTSPSEAELGLALKAAGKLIDPVQVSLVRQDIVRELAEPLCEDLERLRKTLGAKLDPKASDGKARGVRSLVNLALAFRARLGLPEALDEAARLVARSSNMTDKIAGLSILSESPSPLYAPALAAFEKRYKDAPTIMDEWLAVQAGARLQGVLTTVRGLLTHPAFTLNNPNRVSALLGTFAGNPFGFHAEDGLGYAFLAEQIERLDPINPHSAARLAKPFLRWRDFDTSRQALMRKALKRLAAKPLSANTREVVMRSLKG